MTHDNKNYIVIHQYFIFISVFENTYLQLEKQFWLNFDWDIILSVLFSLTLLVLLLVMKMIFNGLHFQMTDSARLKCQLTFRHLAISIYIL